MRSVLWYQARFPRIGRERLPNQTTNILTTCALGTLRDQAVPLMRRHAIPRVEVEVWQSIGPHNSVLLKTGELYADRRVSWYRSR